VDRAKSGCEKQRTFKMANLLALAAASAAIATPAFAGYRTMEVRTNDLDLSQASGQATLQSRIDRAVKQVCKTPAASNITEQREVRQCEAEARIGAQAQAARRIAAYDKTKRNVVLASD
jgi:UrcA family protein